MGGFFSDPERGPRARIESEISETAWRGVEAAIQSRVADGSFGYRDPMQCPDGSGPYGCDEKTFWAALRANVPDLSPLLGMSYDARASQKPLREVLEREAHEISGIGSQFQIRHSEVGKTPVEREDDMDYLFHRAFALMRFLLRTAGRGG